MKVGQSAARAEYSGNWRSRRCERKAIIGETLNRGNGFAMIRAKEAMRRIEVESLAKGRKWRKVEENGGKWRKMEENERKESRKSRLTEFITP